MNDEVVIETLTDDGYFIVTIEAEDSMQPNVRFITIVSHPESKEREIYKYENKAQAILHHKLLAEGGQYGDDKKPNRWIQIVKELSESE